MSSAYRPAAWQQAIEIGRTAKIHAHVIGDRYIFATAIKDFYVIAGVAADEHELAEAVLAQAAIAHTVAGSFAGGIQ